MKSPLPVDETERLAALQTYAVLDSPPESTFDDLTALAAKICDTPVALITLLDEKRQWFKSVLGLKVTETPRDLAICAHTIGQRGLFVVPDATLDARFADNALVTGEPFIRFYAGAPLVTPAGHALGALCVIDRRARQLTDEQQHALGVLSRHVVTQLELRRRSRDADRLQLERDALAASLQHEQSVADRAARSEEDVRRLLEVSERSRRAFLTVLEDQQLTAAALRASEERFRTIFEQAPLGIAEGEIATARFVSVNQRYAEILGYTREELQTMTFKDYTHPDDLTKDLAEFAKLAAGEIRSYAMEKRYRRKDGAIIWVNLSITGLGRAGEPQVTCMAVIDDITARKAAALEVQASREQLRALLARLQRAREEERIRVAREVHDELGQLLTGLKMDVRWLERKLSEPGLPPALNPLLDRAVAASEMADTTIATVQRIAAELRPGMLDQLGLAVALTREARRFQERSGVRCAVVAAEAWPVLPAETASELFYLCQEALTNVARHAQATAVAIALRAEAGATVFEVSDDGVGLPDGAERATAALGLTGMRERAAQCGGTLVVARNETRGTRVTVRIGSVAPAAAGRADL